MSTDIDPIRELEAAAEFDRQMRKENADVRAQNDAFRSNFEARLGRDRVVITSGLKALGSAFCQRAFQAVRAYDSFTEANDPWGEHDFGTFEIDGHPLCWKIDLYDNELEMYSPDPRDPTQTRRVLTIMLQGEY
ncbi:DUF3768 domain-containing protein [Hyphomicrobium sp.]|uniref:DUF3768 domain-containing protein n=1 Tax=Hyphomicrobium sp. TaxID=82 RepID=UPI002E351C88|nr:DUF3768 domain-containing protein [Hyphomicrobium sp.]HEX2841365.1 DUF3768 domain-containing protein [Hyphomicrobium sp.]